MRDDRISRVAVCLLAAAVVLAWSGSARAQAAPAGKVLIRPIYREGQALRYHLKLSGAAAWTPKLEGFRWGKMATDFTFVLAAKTLRNSGACTFRLLGEQLRSTGEGPDGAAGVEADRQRSRIKVRNRWEVWSDRTPLTRPMTMTFGPRGAFRFGTGLLPVAIYMLPAVDHRFWTVLTVAPGKQVAPGDKWEDAFQFPVPGAPGTPLKLTARWEVLDWRTYRKQRVLAIGLRAGLDLKDSPLILKNGDRVHVTSGTYDAAGEVLWDPTNGLLCSATARQKILAKVDKPVARALRSEFKSSLKLLEAKKPPTR